LRIYGRRSLARVAAAIVPAALPLAGATQPAPLVLTVVAAGIPMPPGQPSCSPLRAVSCIARLSQAVDVLQSAGWQRQLPGRISRVQVSIDRGVHRATQAIVLRWGYGSTAGIPLEITGSLDASGARASVLSGALPVDMSRRKRPPARVPGEVATYDLGSFAGFERAPPRGSGLPIKPGASELFLGDRALPLAAWPNEGYARIDRPADIPQDERRTFSVAGRDVLDWRSETDLRAFAYWYHDWSAQTFNVGVVEPGRLRINAADATYGIRTGQRVRIENALSELDRPGEWYLDRASRELHVWMPPESAGVVLELSVAAGLLRVESSRGVVVRDIALEKTRGDAVVVVNSQDVVLQNVSIRHTGNRGMLVDGGERCGIRGSLIEHNGDGGVVLSGGDRLTLAPAHHFADDNVFRDFSRLSATYRPAVRMDGVGQRAVGNVMSQAPHAAIVFTGNDHRIVRNEVFDVVTETDDAGAIYTGKDYTARGTVIEDNFLHDIRARPPARDVKGIYLDDQASGIVVRGNIFSRVQQPVYIGGGRDNLIEANVFYESSPAIHLDARGLTWQRDMTLDPAGDLRKKLGAVPYAGTEYAKRYPHLANILDDALGTPKYNVARKNVVVNSTPSRIEPSARSGIEISDLREAGEDIFAVATPAGGRTRRGDFALK